MNILEKIVSVKMLEVAEAKKHVALPVLEKSEYFSLPANSMVNALRNSATGIIAEYKRASPSKGTINDQSAVSEVVDAYVQHGAAGVSVLTDSEFFKGSLQDLLLARKTSSSIPLLRKEFIIDEYQLIEAKSFGADVILLIAACLSINEVKKLSRMAKNLGLEVLLEIHTDSEVGHICDAIDLVGVNNRDLKTFTVDIERSVSLSNLIPAHLPRVSESGISNIESIQYLQRHGFNGFLIGENFMRDPNPAIAFARFVEELLSAKTKQQELPKQRQT